ncbi:MAG: hypothetical protein HC844_03330 [Tabrizicola sp.]|nr:hypothetical protein [Tabrizicola sp.]
MKAQFKFYLSIFLRRLPQFLVLSTIIATASIIVAMALPPAYVSQMRLIVEAPQITDNTPANTNVATPAVQQLRVTQERLLTRANLLEIARKFNVLPDQETLTSDEIIEGMLSRTEVEISAGRDDPPIMMISFEAGSAETAAKVLEDYLALIKAQDTGARTERATITLNFFQQEVDRLNQELAEKSAAISAFKTANIEALPDSLQFRLSRQADMQERITQYDRDILSLQKQRILLIDLFESTGEVAEARLDALSPEEIQLDTLKSELSDALAIYSPENPRVKVLKARIAQLEVAIRALPAPEPVERPETGNPLLDLQLAEIDTRIVDLKEQKGVVSEEFDNLTESIEKTPANTVKLDELTLDYQNTQLQYNIAVDRLAKASTGERIEFMDRGQRIAVIEPPAVPDRPSKPKRLLIAGGGSFFGFLAGLGLVVLLEVMNRTIRRPDDLVRAIGVLPLATLPYIQTRGEVLIRRSRKLLLIIVIPLAISAIMYAVHIYYQPLDVLAERLMNKLGVRW